MKAIRKITTFLFPLAGFVAILISMNAYQYFKLKSDFAANIIQEVSEFEKRELQLFFKDIENTLQLIRDWGKNDILLSNDTIQLNKKLFPLLERQKSLASIIIANDTGQEYFLYKDGNSFLTRTSAVTTENNILHFQKWSSTDGPEKSWQEPSNYDPRDRPWFIKSVRDEEIHWSRVYTFFHSQTKGITASAAWEISDPSSKYCVVGVDIPLQEIEDILTLRNNERPGLLFLSNSDGSYFVTGDSPGDQTLPSVKESQSREIISSLLEKWRVDNQPGNKLVTLQRDGQKWLAVLQKLQHSQGEFWIGVAAKERALLNVLNEKLFKVDGMDLGLATLGGIIVLFVMRRLGAFQKLREKPAPIVRLLDYLDQGEGPTIEFKSTVRTNLKTGKQGKEIELAWLKAVVSFLNMKGGTLLLGVNDQGDIHGIHDDNFDNTDRCLLHIKNLLNQHIGAEFSGLITSTPVECEKDEIIMLECVTAKEPVFLKIGKNEEFYIRSGPSSVKLSPSQTVSFVLQKKEKT